jgi:hypothetical protein
VSEPKYAIEQVTAVRDAIAETLGDAYDCTRVWSAWGVGTMSQDDFVPVADDNDRLQELAVAALDASGASDLLAALQMVKTWIDGWNPSFSYDPSWPECAEQIEASIAKALGASNANV